MQIRNTSRNSPSEQKEKWKCSCSIVSNSLWPHGLQPARLLCPWKSSGKNIGGVCHFLLQGIFPTQGLNPALPHCRQILYHLSHQGSPLSPNSVLILQTWNVRCLSPSSWFLPQAFNTVCPSPAHPLENSFTPSSALRLLLETHPPPSQRQKYRVCCHPPPTLSTHLFVHPMLHSPVRSPDSCLHHWVVKPQIPACCVFLLAPS